MQLQVAGSEPRPRPTCGNHAMEWLCWLGLAVVAITLIGHGLWVLAARILGFHVRATKTNGGALRRCPRCREVAQAANGRCLICGWSTNVAPGGASEADDLARTAGQLARFARAGLIDAPTHARLTSVIRDEQERLRAGVGGTPPPLPVAPAMPIPVLPLPSADLTPAREEPAPYSVSETDSRQAPVHPPPLVVGQQEPAPASHTSPPPPRPAPPPPPHARRDVCLFHGGEQHSLG
jgi:hypothetical protein